MRQLVGVVSPDPDGTGPLTPTARQFTYNANGQVTVSSVGMVTDQSDAAWNNYSEAYHQYWHYDAYSRPDRTTMWSNGTDYAVEDFVYDSAGRLQCSIQYMNPANWGPQASSCTPLQTNGPNGPDRVTKTSYDAAGNVTLVTSAYGTADAATEVAKTYNPDGTIATEADGKNNLTTYVYDGFDRLRKIEYPSAGTAGVSNTSDYEQFTYDPNGNVLTKRTRGGDTLTYTYDALNRLTSKIVPAKSGVPSTDTRNVYYGYDLMGHPLYARFDSATGEGVSFAYNALGEMTSTTQAMDGASRTLSYQYDAAGNRTRITHPDGAYFTYNFDPLSRLSTMSWWTAASGTVAFAGASYNSLGQRTSMGRGSSGTDYTYDAIGRLHSVLQRFAGGTGNITQTFGYNPASQIASQTRDNDAYTWTDAHDTDRSYTANGLNQYSVVTAPNGTFNFTYDANGNLTYDGVNTYTYDVENRLVSRNGDGRTASLRYDPLGRLYEVVGSTTGTTRFLYDGDSLVAEYDPSGTMLQRYAWGSNPDELVMMDQGSSLNCSATRMAQPDERGSIIATADCWGNRQSINTYDEYGIPGSGNTGRFQYTGQAWLPDAALYYYKARMYSPTLGRFMQTDPIGYGDGMNMYRYVGNDPVNGIDPSGLDWVYQPTTVCVGDSCGHGGQWIWQPGSSYVYGAGPSLGGFHLGQDDIDRERQAFDSLHRRNSALRRSQNTQKPSYCNSFAYKAGSFIDSLGGYGKTAGTVGVLAGGAVGAATAITGVGIGAGGAIAGGGATLYLSGAAVSSVGQGIKWLASGGSNYNSGQFVGSLFEVPTLGRVGAVGRVVLGNTYDKLSEDAFGKDPCGG